MSTINIAEIQHKLYETYLKPSGWGDKLKPFLLSDDFKSILETLLNESNNGERFTPILKQIFRTFQECHYDNLKVVIIGQDPYPKANIADGIAFSCSNTGQIQASLRNIFKEIERTVYPDGYSNDPDLKRWCNQGVLMLNTALTTTISKIGVHIELWRPFIAFLLDMLSHYNSGLVYVFMGIKAKEWAKYVNQNNYKFFVMHPAAAAYRKGVWDSANMFNQINKILKQNYNTEITW